MTDDHVPFAHSPLAHRARLHSPPPAQSSDVVPFPDADIAIQKRKRAEWLAHTEAQLAATHKTAKKAKELAAQRAMIGVIVLWIVVIAIIVGFVLSTIYEGSKQSAILRSVKTISVNTGAKKTWTSASFWP